MTRAASAALALAAFTLAACGDEASETAAEGPLFTAETAGDLDEFLVDPGDRPVYLFSTDTRATDGDPPALSCSEECRTIWPVVATEAPPVAGEGVDASKLVWWEDGPVPGLVTYDGWPLYLYERDDADSPPYGHAKESYGGQWLLMGVDGASLPL